MGLRAACDDSNDSCQEATIATAEAEVIMWHRIVIESLISWCQSLQKLQHCCSEAGASQTLPEAMRTKLRDEVNALILMARLDEPAGQSDDCAAAGYETQQGMDSQTVCEQNYPRLLQTVWKCAAMSDAGSAACAQEAASKHDAVAAFATPPTAVGISRASSVEEFSPEPLAAPLRCRSQTPAARPVVAKDLSAVTPSSSRSRSGSGRLRLPGSSSGQGYRSQAEPSTQTPPFACASGQRSSRRLQLRPGTGTARARSLTRDEAIQVVAAELHKHLGPTSRGPTRAA